MTAFAERPDGTKIAYDIAGAGPPVVFLHGLAGNRRRWAPVTDLLMDSFTCIRIDVRGHGESSAAGDYTMPLMVADVQAVAEQAGLGVPVVVGHSMGGTLAALFGVVNPARAVVVVDQPLRIGDFAARVRPLEQRLKGDGFTEAMLEFEQGLGLGPLAGAARAELEAAIRGADREFVLALWGPLFSAADEELNSGMAAALAGLRAPCLALHGSQPAAGYAEWLTGHAPSAEIEVWEGMGHCLHLVDPVRFAGRVKVFLARSRG